MSEDFIERKIRESREMGTEAIAGAFLRHFEADRILNKTVESKLAPVPRYEWHEVLLLRRWWLKLTGRKPPYKPYEMPSNPGDTITFRRPDSYLSVDDPKEEHF